MKHILTETKCIENWSLKVADLYYLVPIWSDSGQTDTVDVGKDGLTGEGEILHTYRRDFCFKGKYINYIIISLHMREAHRLYSLLSL